LVAVVVYVIEPAPWQRTDVAGANAAIVTVGVIVTVWLVDTDPATPPTQPAAVAVMVVDPVHPADHVTAPVELFIVLLPSKLAASRL
jgi:hypothetical protein